MTAAPCCVCMDARVIAEGRRILDACPRCAALAEAAYRAVTTTESFGATPHATPKKKEAA